MEFLYPYGLYTILVYQIIYFSVVSDKHTKPLYHIKDIYILNETNVLTFLFLSVGGVEILNKRTQENIRTVTETEIDGYDLEKLELKLKKFAKLVSDCDDLIRDCTENLQTAAKMEDIKESKDLKARINDAAANREIFEVKVMVTSLKIRQLRHEEAIKLCGDSPVLPAGMDPLTFGTIMDHIYERTESALISDPKSLIGKTRAKQIAAVVKSNPTLKEYIKG